MRQVNVLSRDEMFTRLRQMNAAKAIVEFSGGGDEGGVDSITLYDGEGRLLASFTPQARSKLEENYSGSRWDGVCYVPVEPDTPNNELARALAAPVHERYGSFAGEFYVTGTVVYDVVAGLADWLIHIRPKNFLSN